MSMEMAHITGGSVDMAENFKHLMFTPGVREIQEAKGSRASYARMEGDGSAPDALDDTARAFIESRDTFYMASVTETGWPYVQHRGGPPGFLRVLDRHRIAFADFSGNRQYISTANFRSDDRVALILMDYPNRQRLKLVGRAVSIEHAENPALVDALMPPGYPAQAERGFMITVEGLEWNCAKYISQRFTVAELAGPVEALKARITALEAENSTLKEKLAS